ncbi:argininosuccinate lyase [Candidatus Bathyarchaeota archaeon]|nr:argininosuccinate lyase [Candidatus Bathyarchaeota archaeon]
MSKLLRGGRIPKVKDDVVKFISSIKSDQKLLKAVIRINQAHVIMLSEQGIISRSEASKLLKALDDIDAEAELPSNVEDVHMFIEEKVIDSCGLAVGGNVHLAKSRNDQVTAAIRMELREELIRIINAMLSLQENLLRLAGEHIRTFFIGYTHMQPAQPITFAHYIISQFDALNRDIQRLNEAYTRVNLCPMGAGAIATTSFPINRHRVAELLAFDGILENSLDAVSSRDFILEVMAALTILAVDVTRLVEDLILWSSFEVNLIELPDDFCSTSSIMPQKKNPDALEVIRARMSYIIGNYVTAVNILKSLPSGYNLDFQEITPKLWESTTVIKECLDILSELLINLKIRKDIISKPLFSFLAATELANTLVRNYQIPFRVAHKITGALVRELNNKGLALKDVTPELLNGIAKSLGYDLNLKNEDLEAVFNISKVIESHDVIGGPSYKEVERMLKLRKKELTSTRSKITRRMLNIEKSFENLRSIVNNYLSGT